MMGKITLEITTKMCLLSIAMLTTQYNISLHFVLSSQHSNRQLTPFHPYEQE